MRIPVLMALFSALTLPAGLPAQQNPAPATNANTLHADAKLVVVDVVVTDHGHRPIHDLKQRDFSIFEGGKPQPITSFEEHRPLDAAKAAKLPALPPMPAGTFSNYSPTPINSALNVLLLDTLNTAKVDQSFMRGQILKYLQNARPGANTAIFGLSTKLVMLQGFTTDPGLLKAVVSKQSGKSSPLLDDPVNGGLHKTAAEESAAMGLTLSPDELQQLQTFLDASNSVTDTARAQDTLHAMNLLAHYLSAIPGRKNLIWFSGGFPLSIAPDATNPTSDPFIGMANADQEYRETLRLFATSQVAVYPVDARGLMIGTGSVVKDMALADPHFTMLQMAEDTGGHAFINTNGLAEAVDSAIEDGSSYYTLAYRPTNMAETGRFRKTEVKLEQKGYLLAYRHGYYEDEPHRARPTESIAAASDPSLSLMTRAMMHGTPASSEILFKARVLPAAAAAEGQRRSIVAEGLLRRYAVDFAVLPSDIAYTTTPDGLRHFDLEIMTLAHRPDGSVANRAANVLKGSVTPAQFAALQKYGFPYHQEINVPIKGDYTLRLGVFDRNGNRVGAIELPVSSVKSLQPAVNMGTSSAPASAHEPTK